MANPTQKYVSPLERLTGKIILKGIHLLWLDEYATEIFDLWYSGTAGPVETFDNPKWAAYMQADKGLEAQIDRHMIVFAAKLRDEEADRGPGARPFGVTNRPFETAVHGAEVGSTSIHGYKTGYSFLHGVNKLAGGFKITGLASLKRAPGSTTIEAQFSNTTMTFNDIVDPNYRYSADVTFEQLARNLTIAEEIPKPMPRNYKLRIIWRDPSVWHYDIPAAPGTLPPGFFPEYQWKPKK